jgi:cytochrome c peroxidase
MLKVLIAELFFVSSLSLAAVPTAVIIESPKNTASLDNTPTYKWRAVTTSSWYYLWVNDSTGNKIKKWYTAQQAGCSGGEAVCSVTSTTSLANGSARWWVLTWNNEGNGAWSQASDFSLTGAVPETATLIRPNTVEDTNSKPTYEWQAATGVTWYYLWVNDSSGNKVKKWYTQEQVGCSNGETSCSITPDVSLLNGAATWWIQTWNNTGYGAWSKASHFSIEDSIGSILDLPEVVANYSNPALPVHFTTAVVRGFDNTPNSVEPNDRVATLGRVLFYEKRLSANHSTSCASCHIQKQGFSDPSQFSEGFNGGLTGRNSMGLANARFYENGHFFWDERAATLAEQTLIPIQNDVEMGLTLAQAVANLSGSSYQPSLFEWAYGDSAITPTRIADALSQFVRSLVSYQSKYDQGVTQNFRNFTTEENRGRQLFFSMRTHCAACHVNRVNNDNRAIFQPSRAINNGLDAGVNADNGVGDITGNQGDNGRFKSSSLRNIELTGPYMHDGRFTTLAEVIEHYNSGVQNHPNLDQRLKNRGGGGGGAQRLNLSSQEKLDLESFLKTLTDDVFITEVKFSNPFRQ